jgi:uncharacterized LabA/DUF88 family protein
VNVSHFFVKYYYRGNFMNNALKTILLFSDEERENMIAQQRYMFFIDGENLVFRYQDMIKDGFIPVNDNKHVLDTYIWSARIDIPRTRETQIIREYYYTSVYGDEVKLQAIASELKKLNIPRPQNSASSLYPVLFKKHRKNDKAKCVDIQLTVDILSHVYQNNLDTICLFSGDGDFAPVLEEAIKYGKRVYIGALSNGLSPKLKGLADEFINLDAYLFDLEAFNRNY